MWVWCHPIFFPWKIEQWVFSVEEWWLIPVKFNSLTLIKIWGYFKDSNWWNINNLKCCGHRECRCFQGILRKTLFFSSLWIPVNSPKPLKRKSDYWADSSTETDHNDSQWMKRLISYECTLPGKELWDNMITHAHSRSLYLWVMESEFTINRPVSHDRISSSI